MTAPDTLHSDESIPGLTPAEPDALPEDEELLEFYQRRFKLRSRERSTRRAAGPVFRDASEGASGRIVGELTDAGQLAGYQMTYTPARFETGWLRSSLRSFYDQELIVDVLAQVKGGKEANVYRCRAHPRLSEELLAAKVYRPRKLRNLANDRLYREGRAILTAEGRPAKPTDSRIMRALGKKTAYGVQVQHTSWLMHEYTTLARLHRAGGAVPAPFSANENAILMGYRGDEQQAAPTLHEVRLSRREARPLFEEVMRNIELLLQNGQVHGDLSAYNILYWEGQITLIDFPQVTDVPTNRNARVILERDVQRVCQYFAGHGIRSDSAALVADLWDRYGQQDYGAPDLAEEDPSDLEDDLEDDEPETAE